MARLVLISDVLVFLLIWYVDDYSGIWFLFALLHFIAWISARPLPGYARHDRRTSENA